MGRADRAPIKVTSVLNGAFMDMLGGQMPIIQPRLRRVLHWGDPGQPLDFTTKDDAAAYTAAAALDERTPRILRIAGDTVTARDIAWAMSDVSGQPYRPLWVGGVGALSLLIHATQLVAPQRETCSRHGRACSTCVTCLPGGPGLSRSTTTATPTSTGPRCASSSPPATRQRANSPTQAQRRIIAGAPVTSR